MKSISSIVLLFLLPVISSAQNDPVDHVNLFTGTSNSRWMLGPHASLPLGMVKLGPDNQGNVWNGGYEYTIGSISGFSHIHAMSLGGLSIMPVTGNVKPPHGEVKGFPGPPDGPFAHMWTAGYRSRFKKETEEARPGYYMVQLLDYDVDVELTATHRCGMLRFRFPEDKEAHILIDFDFPQEEMNLIKKVEAELINPRQLQGYVLRENQYADEYAVYFAVESNIPFSSMDGWVTEDYQGGERNYGTEWRKPRQFAQNLTAFESEESSGIILNLPGDTEEPLILRTGLSMVNRENAWLNLEEEMEPLGWDFYAVRAKAEKTWNELLGRIEVKGSKENIAKFYTNLYRAYSGRCMVNDVNGEYRDMCEEVRTLKKPADAVYSSDGFWGAQWNLAPLWTLLTPELANSYVNSFLELSRAGGWIPEAPTGLEYAPIMEAQHHNSIIISAFQKGIQNFDYGYAFEAILHDYTRQGIEHPCGGFAGNRQMQAYMDYGYVPEEYGPVSNTLEYAYDDWCFAQFARALGNTQEYHEFLERSMNYINIYDEETGFMRRRHKNGDWVTPFDPYKYGTEGGWNGPGYMESNAFQSTFFVPHNLEGLISLMGKERFNKLAEKGFTEGLFDLGNQPCLHTPFLFNYSDKPWLTQRYSRMVVEEIYDLSPYQGWVGEEDEGQMGASFVLMSMGLFQMDGGCALYPYYDLGSPLFDEIVIRLDDRYYSGKVFRIVTRDNSFKNMYVQRALLNGEELTEAKIPHDVLVRGGELILEMGPEPNYEFFK